VLLFALALALLTLSVVMVYSASSYVAARRYGDHFFFFKRQLVWCAVGITAMFVASRIDYQKLTHFAKPLLWVSFILLLLCYVPGVGKNINGQSRWIGLAGFTFQPSELAKLALVIFMAKTLSEKRDQLRSFTAGFLPAAGITGIFLLAIVMEQDLGATFVIGLIVWLMWFVAGMRLTHLMSLVVAAVPAFAFFILSSSWRMKRMLAFLNPEDHQQGAAAQLLQSLIGIGSGGLMGRGLGQGMQKNLYIPELHTDFIFANIGEELGLIGCMAVVLIFIAIIVIGTTTALRMPDFYGSILACGLTMMLTLPAMVNMAVVTGLMPTKGLPLPLVSYGGSQVLVNMTAVGILMNVVYHRNRLADSKRRTRV
jgi:cell division protein FtsW